ncbi:MAG: sterol carrier family protein, partial [Demequina sp.]
MSKRRIDPAAGRAAVRAWIKSHGDQTLSMPEATTTRDAAPTADRVTTATAVRYCLEELAAQAPGGSLEVRVPPFGATQCIEGPRHTRGTPPGVVEMDSNTWLALSTGTLAWPDALASGAVTASGERANLERWLPL